MRIPAPDSDDVPPAVGDEPSPTSGVVAAAMDHDEKRSWRNISSVAMAWSCCTLLCGYYEFIRLQECAASPSGVLGWLANWNAETTLPLMVLLLLPALITFQRCSGWNAARSRRAASISRPDAGGVTVVVLCGVLFTVSIAGSAFIGGLRFAIPGDFSGQKLRFADLPPTYHDEFSYLLQARTFLAGRLSWPGTQSLLDTQSPPGMQPLDKNLLKETPPTESALREMTALTDLFHQIHVVNAPRTASRYFPWTGIWIAPFEAIGMPIVGHWIAGGLSCVFCFLSLRMLTSDRTALLGSGLMAVSPGLAVFSNLLLAHHPTMLALSVFLWSFLVLRQTGRTGFAWLSGTALALAMLGRPMTAAGFALPMGVWLLLRMLRGDERQALFSGGSNQRAVILGMGIPLLAGFGVLAVMNHQITGSWRKSAYQHYTDTWTPRHRYGFNNVVIAQKHPPVSDVLDAYDRWAVNLTVPQAVQNVGHRALAGSQWAIGIIPVLFGLLMAVGRPVPGTDRTGIRLFWMSIVSLHAVHIPYWFDGILHWHYVFETAPLMLMLVAVGFSSAFDGLRRLTGPRTARLWLAALAGASLLPGWVSAESFWGPSKVTLAAGEQAFSRIRMERFRRLTTAGTINRPALILVDESGSDPQLSYIVNPPDLKAELLVCRRPADDSGLAELRTIFPDRCFYDFDPRTFSLVEHSARNYDNRKGVRNQ